jgi:hypothetical protein
MVVFVDLESDDDDSSLLARYAHRRGQLNMSGEGDHYGNDRVAREAGFAAVLTCYPYATTENEGHRTTRCR